MSSESLSAAEDGEDEQTVGLISNNMEARAEHQKTKNYRLLYGLTTCVGLSLVTLVLIWCFHFRGGFAWSSNPQLEFNWHPLLMTIGMVFIFGQSALIYRTGSNSPKKTLKIWHALLHSCTFVLVVIGLKAVFDSHNYAKPDPIPNLYSLHSWIGLVTVILFTGQLLFGFVCFLYPGLSKTLRSTMLPVHVMVGTAIFTSAVITAMLGLSEKAFFLPNYSSLPAEGILMNFIGVILAVFGILVLYLVNESSYKRVAQPEDELTLTDSTE